MRGAFLISAHKKRKLKPGRISDSVNGKSMFHLKSTLSFLENPASPEEKEVARLMEKYFSSLEKRDVDGLVSCFHEEACIGSQAAGKIVNRREYEEALRRTMPLTYPVHLREILIRVDGPDTATVSGLSQYGYRGRLGRVWKRVWKLKSAGEAWLIVNSGYYRE